MFLSIHPFFYHTIIRPSNDGRIKTTRVAVFIHQTTLGKELTFALCSGGLMTENRNSGCFLISTHLSIYSFLISHLSYMSIYLSIYLSSFLSIYLSMHLHICLSIYLSIYLSIQASIYPSIYFYPSIQMCTDRSCSCRIKGTVECNRPTKRGGRKGTD